MKKNDSEDDNIEIHLISKFETTTKEKIIDETKVDPTLKALKEIVLSGWPSTINEVPEAIRQFWNFRDELTYDGGILYKSTKIVIPKTLQPEIISKVHSGHQGIQRSLSRARSLVFWIGMHNDVKNFVEKCSICQSYQPSKPKEPLIVKPVPSLPWEIVATDLFSFRGNNYLLIVDSYSGFMDFALLEQSTSYEIIQKLKTWFATHGIPQTLESDNGPQFSSKEFFEFTKAWDIQHQTSSPYYPRSNGLAERYVQSAKSILKKCSKDNSDIYLALLNYRNTPRSEDLQSPNQRLMSRVTRSTIPSAKDILIPKVVPDVQFNISRIRNKNKNNFDKNTKNSQPIQINDRVRIQKGHRNWVTGTVENMPENLPRSFFIRTDDGKLLRRNSIHVQKTKATIPVPQTVAANISPTPSTSDTAEEYSTPNSKANTTISPGTTTSPCLPATKVSRYGRPIKPPQWYKP